MNLLSTVLGQNILHFCFVFSLKLLRKTKLVNLTKISVLSDNSLLNSSFFRKQSFRKNLSKNFESFHFSTHLISHYYS